MQPHRRPGGRRATSRSTPVVTPAHRRATVGVDRLPAHASVAVDRVAAFA